MRCNISCKYRTVSFFQVLFVACIWAQDKPSWVDNRPVETNYYIGIGVATRENTSVESAKETATQIAINDIAIQLQIGVESSSESVTQENNTSINTEFSSQIKTQSNVKDLKHVEIVDTWIERNTVWVFARLSKLAHKREMLQKEAEFRSQALSLFSDYLSTANEDAAQRIKLLLLSAYKLHTNNVKDFTDEFQNQSVSLDTLISSALQRETKSIHLRPQESTYQIKSGSNDNTDIEIKVTRILGSSSKPVGMLPVKLYLERESNGRFDPIYFSDNQGIVTGKLRDVVSQGGKLNGFAAIDYAALIDQEEDLNHPYIQRLIAGLGPSPVSLQFETTDRMVLVEYEADQIEQSALQKLQREFKRAISTKGLVYTQESADRDNADICISFTISEDRNSNAGNITFTYMNFDLDVSNCSTREMIMNRSKSAVKGGGNSLNAARDRAINSYVKKDLTNFADELLDIGIK